MVFNKCVDESYKLRYDSLRMHVPILSTGISDKRRKKALVFGNS